MPSFLLSRARGSALSEETEPYTDGRTKLTFTPVYPYHSTYYLSLYRVLYANDNAANTEILSAMSDVCKWFFDAQENGNVPDLSTETCVKLELLTPRAIRRMTYEDVNGQKIQDFYIVMPMFLNWKKISFCIHKKSFIRRGQGIDIFKKFIHKSLLWQMEICTIF